MPPMKQPKVAVPKVETIDVSVVGICANCPVNREVMMVETNHWIHTDSMSEEC